MDLQAVLLRAAKQLRLGPFAALRGSSTDAQLVHSDLDRQERFGPVWGQVGIKGVDEQG
jgi:hypothetical protein